MSFVFGPSHQIGPRTLDHGKSNNAAIEAAELKVVGSYGRQLGKIEEALALRIAMLKKNKTITPTPVEDKIFKALTDMADGINEIKKKHPLSEA